jgi:subtilisin-like proprotein convertase family protein
VRLTRKRSWLAVSIVALSTLFLIDPVKAFQVRQEKTPLDDRVIVDPVATMNGDAVPLESTAVAGSKKAAWGRLSMNATGGWRVLLDAKSGAPLLVDGVGIPWAAAAPKGAAAPTLEALEDSFRKFLADNRDILLADDAELRLDRDASVELTPNASQVVFDHVVAGIPVLGDKYVFMLGHGNLVLFGASRWTPVTTSPVPAIGSAEALGRLQIHMGLAPSTPMKVMGPGELFFLPREVATAAGPGYGTSLIWRVVVQVDGHPGTWVGYVDANDGTVRAFFDDDKYAQVKGGVLPESTDGICPSGCEQPGFPMPFADLTIGGNPSGFSGPNGLFSCTPGGATATTTLSGQFVRIADVCGTISRSATCDADLDLGLSAGIDCSVPAGASPGDTKAARTGFYHINRVKERVRGWLPGNVWLTQQLTENTNVNQVCNANWSGGQLNMFRSGSGCNNTGEIAGVVIHEFGHGLDENDGGGFDNPSEAYADINEFLHDRTSCVGRGFFQSGVCSGYGNPCTTCNGIRDMNWSARANNVPSTPSVFISNCQGGSGPCGKEVHCEGYLAGETIWDLATRDLPASGLSADSAWQLTDRLWNQSRSGSTGNAYTCSGGTGNSCGAGHWMTKIRVADDDDGNLANGTPHAAAIFAAFNRHGIACGAAGDATNQSFSTCPALATPTVTTIASTNSVQLSWTSVPNAASYRILRNDYGCNAGQAPVATVAAPTTTYTDIGLANGFNYYYRVQAVGTTPACESQVSACKTATPQPFAGVVTLDKPAYACASSIGISVLDGNIGSSTTAVSIRSTTEPTPEIVTLTQTPPGSATYVGSIPTTPAGPATNGQLSLVNGATITVEYVDADDGIGGTNVLRTATAVADCVGPVISGVTAVDITGVSARITWATNENSSSTVHYGTSAPPSSTTSAGGLVTAHSVPVTSLAECTPYVYSVDSTDGSGNTASDNNGGAYYTFATGKNVNPSFVSTDTPINIPDNNSTGITSTINVAGTKTVMDVNVTVNITHTYVGDLRLSLLAPNGATIPLATNLGGSGDNFVDTVFDDEAATPITAGGAPFTGSFRPQSPLTAAEGGSAAGAWRLKVVDTEGQDFGPLNGWTLTLTFPNEACGPHARLSGRTDIADVCAAGGAGGNGRWDAGETVSFGLTVHNDGTDPLTGITATVTSPTPGVGISNGTQPISNLAAGASGTSGAPHVSVKLPSGIACGSNVAFDVEIVTNQGTWLDSFTHGCGQVVAGSATPINENFAGGIPAGWSIVDGGAGGGAAATWTTANPAGRNFTSPLVAPVAVVDSDFADQLSSQDEELITPVMNLSTATVVTLQYDHYFRWYNLGLNEIADVDVRSASTGGAWVNVVRQQGASSPNPQHRNVDISQQAAGASDVQVRFHYYNAQYEWWWQVDNVRVDATAPAGCNMVPCNAVPVGAKPVADGSFGAPMTADRGNALATSINVTWDVSTCSSADHEILYGNLASVASSTVTGSFCGLGVSGAATWTGVPAGNLWFVVVGADNFGTEGSWGLGTGGQRGGTAASGQCGNGVRDNTATCP